MSAIKVEQVGFSCGARIVGADLSRPLSEADVKVVRDAWLKHLVLVFP